MCAYKDNSEVESVKKREYLKQQHQLRTMIKTNNTLSADDMIENLLSKKEIFRMKKDSNPPATKTSQPNYPPWLYPGHEPALYKRVWDIVCTPSGFADTPKLTSILLTSRLPTDILGYIWSLSNISLAPGLSQLEMYTALALIALVQSGYSFTSGAVINTLKEAPIPKLDYPLTDASVLMPCHVLPPTLPTAIPPSGVPTMAAIPPSYSPMAMTSETFFSTNIDTIATKPSETSVNAKPEQATHTTLMNSVTQEFSLLDLDSSIPSPAIKSEVQNPLQVVSSSIIDQENPENFLKDEPVKEFTTKYNEKDLINEFSPSKNQNTHSVNSFSSETNFTFAKTEKEESKNIPAVDDMFGDFQSVSISNSQIALSVGEEVEFDDFKSADFTPLTLLEVKEKPPEENSVQIVLPKAPKIEEKSGIEDLFPKCVVKSKEDGFDLLASEEDRYSALRCLSESGEGDDFGDFLTATPSQPASLPQPFVDTFSQTNIQEKAMDACLEILGEATKIFESISEESVLNEVISDPRGIQYLEELIEVERIAMRLRSTLKKIEFDEKLDKVSKSLELYLLPHKNSYMAEESGPKCGICLCEKGPAYVKYGINNFHAPCANLYLHKVDSILPIAPVM